MRQEGTDTTPVPLMRSARRVCDATDRLRTACVRLCALLLGFAGTVQAQEPAFVVLRVVQGSAGTVVPNAEILRAEAPPSRLTDAGGELRLRWDGTTPLVLRVRQIGFAPLDTTVRARPDNGVVLLGLQPLAYRLPDITTVAQRGCPVDPSPIGEERAAVILEQLRIGAGHLEAFRREYRFTVLALRSTAPIDTGRAGRSIDTVKEEINSTEWRDMYAPDSVLSYKKDGGFTAVLLFMSSLASDQFWSTHCFRALESDPAERRPTVRLAFTPKPTVRTPDWSGVAVLDSVSAELLRVDFALANLQTKKAPVRLEGYTNFVRVSPYVMMPSETGSIWWLRAPKKKEKWPEADYAQRLLTLGIVWHGIRPPGTDSVTVMPSPAERFPGALIQPLP